MQEIVSGSKNQKKINDILSAADIPTTVKSKALVEKRRNEIIFAAIELFSKTKKGVSRLTLRELAKEAGISHGNIYDYVGSKEDILSLIHDFISGFFKEQIDRSTSGVNEPLEKLLRMAKCDMDISYNRSEAIQMIYQETQALFSNKALLKRVLQGERDHHLRYELVLEEGIRKGLFKDVNVRATANIIKIMVETWALKRWDLKGFVSQSEMEKTCLDLMLYGLLKEKRGTRGRGEEIPLMEGKSALIINGGTELGRAVSSFFLSEGVRLAVYENQRDCRKLIKASNVDESRITVFSAGDHGEMTGSLFRRIADKVSPIDIVIYDIGAGDSSCDPGESVVWSSERLRENMDKAQDLGIHLEKEMMKRQGGRVVYLTPWGWDMFADPIRYETVRAGTIALTETMAKRMAPAKVCVNCIDPGFIAGTRAEKIGKEKPLNAVSHTQITRLSEITDVLEAIRFLVSEAARNMTGQVLELSGGYI